MKTDLSVIVCCYNSSQRLPKTLEHLAAQRTKDSLNWEVIIVDNNSSDNTGTVAINEWEKFGLSVPLKVVKETLPGLSNARKAGVLESEGEIIIFCDDDNWLTADYIQVVAEVMANQSNIGALGGWCEAAFEENEPEWFGKNSRFFAVSKQGPQSGDITDKKGCVYGAGMATTRKAWTHLHNSGFESLLSDRKGESLASGGDTEYCFALRLLGYKIWYDERLYFKHFMTANRMNLNYLFRIRKAMVKSNNVASAYLDVISRSPKSRIESLNLVMSDLFGNGFKHLKEYLKADGAEKIDAKIYFLTIWERFKGYKQYKNSLEAIGQWHS